ncbi:class I SAM-dependent methyltransferase [Streptomyces sp. WMMB 322]|uniref:class I SAM-dependent methyltransferase n=1 Tax=Streptomyces sp. WMMB 322 TaxID=1286821 RepID=UPI0006E33D0A|nr:class I SAM-dependent methyltransferase [Streptomyces sp. WMMB 322]SCK35667.1 Methyltransferase domain-containing protein [Streptomyces sp. WMMB 322]
MERDWTPDELAHAGPEHLDPGFVSRFDRKQGHPDPAGDLDLLRSHGLSADSVVVDLGAGTGQFAVPAARAFGRVVAVEVSPAMRDVLRERAAAEGLATLECVRGGFLTYEHSGPPADAVFTRHALHQLPDFWKVLALHRIAGMLRPGGILRIHDLVYDVPAQRIEEFVESWLEDAPEDPATGYTREDLAEHIRTEHSTFRWLLEPMLTATGFEIADASFRGSVYASYTCVRR